MTRAKLEDLTVAELVERFAAIGIKQNQALLGDEFAKFTRLYWQMDAIEKELRSRPADQRRALLALFDHRDMQVRLIAAKAILAVEPEAARRMLRAIVDSRRQPQAGDAGMCLWISIAAFSYRNRGERARRFADADLATLCQTESDRAARL